MPEKKVKNFADKYISKYLSKLLEKKNDACFIT